MSVAGAIKRTILSGQDFKSDGFGALATYRTLLRAINLAFHGDIPRRSAALSLARESFSNQRNLEAGSQEASNAVQHALDVSRILRENVVQGARVGEETYKLNIHEHTQRLDNGTAKELKGTTKSFKEIKNAIF